MGRYDFRPSRVLQTSKRQLLASRIHHDPPWVSAVSQNAPAQILVRSQPIQHSGYTKQKAGRKVKRIFQPQNIAYPEDGMRRSFFAHHPWELARPRIVQEGNRLDGGGGGSGGRAKEVWESVRPEGLALQSEK